MRETPFFLVYGRDVNGPSDRALKEWVKEKKTLTQYAKEVVRRLKTARERVRKEVREQKKRMKKRYDKGRKENPYERTIWFGSGIGRQK